MAYVLSDLILQPGEFFRALAAEPAAYKGPVLIVFVWGCLTGIQTFFLMNWLMGAFLAAAPAQPGIGPMAGISVFIALMAAVFAVPMAFVYWGVAALGLYLIGGIFSRTGSIYHTLTAIAWGMIPLAVCDTIRSGVFLLYKNAMTLTISPEFINMTMNSHAAGSRSPSSMSSAELAKYISYNPAFHEYTLVSFAVFAIALLACSWFWFHALQHTRSLTPRQAAITVFVPVLILIGVKLASLLTGGVA